MAVRRRIQENIPERDMTIERLAARRQNAEGHRAILVSMRKDGRWEVSIGRPGAVSTAGVNVGEVGEPLDNVIHNLLVLKAADRRIWRPKEENNPPAPKKKLLKLKRTPGT